MSLSLDWLLWWSLFLW